MDNRTYIAIDLKSFYASVECVDRGLDPLHTNLVVADVSRTEKTICLAVSPSLKSYHIPGRARLFEVVQKVKEVNAERMMKAPGGKLAGSSYDDRELKEDPSLALDYIAAVPRMGRYMEISSKIYQIYLKYVAPEDIHVYSVDEVFIDATEYLKLYRLSAHEFTVKLVREVLMTTGVTATAGIGTNLYLCKIAMDVTAKHIPADKDGVRIAELDEMKYRRELWGHKPITDFWRVGRGLAKRLAENGMFTMGDIARRSTWDEDTLYRLFGINAELLIDHAWGEESCLMKDIKAYRSETNSISSGQVLASPYPFEKGRLIVKEMTDLLVLDLVDKGVMTDQMILTVGYDIENLSDPEIRKNYKGPVTRDPYGRVVPKEAHGSVNLGEYTSSTRKIMEAVTELFDKVVDPSLLIRRMYVVAGRVLTEEDAREKEESKVTQMDLFSDPLEDEKHSKEEEDRLNKEKKMQKAVLALQKRFGKNAVLKGMNLEEGGTTIERNGQIGGHRAGDEIRRER